MFIISIISICRHQDSSSISSLAEQSVISFPVRRFNTQTFISQINSQIKQMSLQPNLKQMSLQPNLLSKGEGIEHEIKVD
jgi:hypothetical protein